MSDEPAAKKRKENDVSITTKSGGAYIPPAKLRLMQQQITDKSRYVKFTMVKPSVFFIKLPVMLYYAS